MVIIETAGESEHVREASLHSVRYGASTAARRPRTRPTFLAEVEGDGVCTRSPGCAGGSEGRRGVAPPPGCLTVKQNVFDDFHAAGTST